MSKPVVIVLGVLCGLMLLGAVLPDDDKVKPSANPGTPGQPAPAPQPAANQPTPDPKLQAERWAFVGKCINEHRIFSKVECPGRVARVTVTPKFYALTFDQKQQFVSVVAAYYHGEDQSVDTVRLIDQFNGKTTGSFHVSQGLSMN